MKKLDYTSRFVRVIPTLSPNQSSHNSIGHGDRYNLVVTASTSQQNNTVLSVMFRVVDVTNCSIVPIFLPHDVFRLVTERAIMLTVQR